MVNFIFEAAECTSVDEVFTKTRQCSQVTVDMKWLAGDEPPMVEPNPRQASEA